MANLVHKARTISLEAQPTESFEKYHTTAASKVLNMPELLAEILVNLDTPEVVVCMLVNKSMHNAITKTPKLRVRIQTLHVEIGRRFNMPGFGCIPDRIMYKTEDGSVFEADQIDMTFRAGCWGPRTLPILGSRWREMLIHQHPLCEFYVQPTCLSTWMVRSEVNTFDELWQQLQFRWSPDHNCILALARALGPPSFDTQISSAFPENKCVRVVALGPWRSVGEGCLFSIDRRNPGQFGEVGIASRSRTNALTRTVSHSANPRRCYHRAWFSDSLRSR